MKFFGSRHRTHRPDRQAASVPTAAADVAAPARLADPIAQAMRAGDRRSADAVWIGGMTFRAHR